MPRAIALTGARVWTFFSQDRQEYLGRTVRMSRHCTGATSSISSLSSPKAHKAPPQAGQVQLDPFRMSVTPQARQIRLERTAGSSSQHTDQPRQRIGIDCSVHRQLHSRRQIDRDLTVCRRGSLNGHE